MQLGLYTLAAWGGESVAGAGLRHGAGTAGAPLLSHCQHPQCCGMQGEVGALVWGTPSCAQKHFQLLLDVYWSTQQLG